MGESLEGEAVAGVPPLEAEGAKEESLAEGDMAMTEMLKMGQTRHLSLISSSMESKGLQDHLTAEEGGTAALAEPEEEEEEGA